MIHKPSKKGENNMAYEILDNRNNTDLEKGLFTSLPAIKDVDFSIHNKEWEKYGGSINKFGRMEFLGGSGGGLRAVFSMLNDKINN